MWNMSRRASMSDPWKLATEWKIPFDMMKDAQSLFAEFCRRPEPVPVAIYDPFKDGLMDREDLTKLLCKLTKCRNPERLPEELLRDAMDTLDRNEGGCMNFEEFVMWFSKHAFTEALSLTFEQRDVRAVARKYNFSTAEVERCKQAFDLMDVNGSGDIDFPEFEKLVHQLLKVPNGMELPASRVKQYWREADVSGNGTVEFEEFVVFYRKYFQDYQAAGASPIEDFYRGVRRTSLPECSMDV